MSLILGTFFPKPIIYALAAMAWVCIGLLVAQLVGISKDSQRDVEQ